MMLLAFPGAENTPAFSKILALQAFSRGARLVANNAKLSARFYTLNLHQNPQGGTRNIRSELANYLIGCAVNNVSSVIWTAADRAGSILGRQVASFRSAVNCGDANCQRRLLKVLRVNGF
ncbi:hypothetical protein [Lacipirellula sp.]|uniref:hypothetical protein n=1 Tax=Lacipirellula sp. TaxID=2691419 RepID=UPI003D0CEC00